MSPRGPRTVGDASDVGRPSRRTARRRAARAERARPLSVAARLRRAARVRVVLALVLLVAGKLVNITVPLLYKHAVDALSPSGAASDRGAGGADPRLRPRPGHVAGLQRAAQRGLRQGRPARGAPGRAGGVPPYPCAVAALSSRTAHRRAGARRSSAAPRHRVPAVLHAVQRRADAVRDPAGLRHPVAALQLDLRRGHARDDRRSTSPSPSS